MRLLILGTGGMARQQVDAFNTIEGVKIVGAVNPNSVGLNVFCDEKNIEKRFSSVEEAIAWGEFEAASNVTPDRIHHQTTLALLKAGKHVFCEKPLATNYADALEMAQTAEQAGLIGMINLSNRNLAELHKMRKMVLAGDIGTLKHVEASQLQSWLVSKLWCDWANDPQWLWRLSTAHGSSGALGDIGPHILDFMAFGAGTDIASLDCRLQTFPKAENDKIGEFELDANDSFVMSVGFENNALGVVHATRWATGHISELRLRVYGDKGGIEVQKRHDGVLLRACLGADVDKAIWRDIKADPVPTNYEKFVRAVSDGIQVEPSFHHGARVQKVLELSAQAAEDGRRHRV